MKENLEELKIADELMMNMSASRMTAQLLEERNSIFEALSFEENNIEKSSDFFEKYIGHIKNNSDIENQYSKVLFELQELRNKAIRDKKLIYDKDGKFQYAIAPNGKKSNLDEFEWCITRSKKFKESFGDWEKFGQDLLGLGFNGWQIKTSYDELVKKIDNEIKSDFPDFIDKDWFQQAEQYLKTKYNTTIYGPFENDEIMIIPTYEEFIKEIAIREKINFEIIYPNKEVFTLLEKNPFITKDIDENGEPRIEYHGGSEKITEQGTFKLNQNSERGNTSSDMYFFTPDKKAGEAYAEIHYKMRKIKQGDTRLVKNEKLLEKYKQKYGEQFLTKVFLNLKNPKFFTRWWDDLNKELSFYGGLNKSDREKGCDSFIMNKSRGDLSVFDQFKVKVDFDKYAQTGCVSPKQIKSPININFSQNNESIYE